jgi:hypothetical protein
MLAGSYLTATQTGTLTWAWVWAFIYYHLYRPISRSRSRSRYIHPLPILGPVHRYQSAAQRSAGLTRMESQTERTHHEIREAAASL